MTKFLVDRMLGRLSAWLRILGYDTVSANSFSGLSNAQEDTYMLRLAASERRILLTRDTQLHLRAKEKFQVPSLLIKEDDVLQQLKDVQAHFAVTFPTEPIAFRCSTCNGIIQVASDDVILQSHEIKTLSAKGVDIDEFMQRHQEFYTCTWCGKVFWKGSHWKEIQQKIHHLRARTGYDCSA